MNLLIAEIDSTGDVVSSGWPWLFVVAVDVLSSEDDGTEDEVFP